MILIDIASIFTQICGPAVSLFSPLLIALTESVSVISLYGLYLDQLWVLGQLKVIQRFESSLLYNGLSSTEKGGYVCE